MHFGGSFFEISNSGILNGMAVTLTLMSPIKTDVRESGKDPRLFRETTRNGTRCARRLLVVNQAGLAFSGRCAEA